MPESNKETRKRNVDTVRKILSYEGEEGLSEDFTPEELESAIKKMKTRKAGGSDGICSDYIKHLTERGRHLRSSTTPGRKSWSHNNGE